MGYNIGAKGVAVGLLALTGNDIEEAKRIWSLLAYEDPRDVEEAMEAVQRALGVVADE